MHHFRNFLTARDRYNKILRIHHMHIVNADALRWSSQSALWQLKEPIGGLVEQPVDGHGKIKQKMLPS